MTGATTPATELAAASAPTGWREMQAAVRRLAQQARAETKRDPDHPLQSVLVALAATLTAIETAATIAARGARETHKKLLRAGVPPPVPDDPDAPLDATLIDIWADAVARADDACLEVEKALTAPNDETMH